MNSRFAPKPLFSRLFLGFALVAANVCAAAQSSSESDTVWLNAFDQARNEQLIQEGLQEMRIGQYEEAERIFLEAMQIAKINFGLEAIEQQPALERAIDAQIALGKWEEVETHLNYFEWLNDEVYTRDFYGYLRGTEQLRTLLLRASADVENPLAVRYLIEAKNLNWRAINGIVATLGEHHPELAPWYYNIVLIHFYQSSMLKRNGMISTITHNENNEEISGWTLTLSDSMRISYRIGRELLQRIETIYEQAEGSSAESAAIALIYQGDWEMLFGNEDQALDLYANAYEELVESGLAAEQVDLLFARPEVLPAKQLHSSVAAMRADSAAPTEEPLQFRAWTPNYPAAELPSQRVAVNTASDAETSALIRFNLHSPLSPDMISRGRTMRLGFNMTNLEVLSSTPDNELVKDRARHEVSLLQFRPRLESGSPSSFENIELEYRFASQYSNPTLSGN